MVSRLDRFCSSIRSAKPSFQRSVTGAGGDVPDLVVISATVCRDATKPWSRAVEALSRWTVVTNTSSTVAHLIGASLPATASASAARSDVAGKSRTERHGPSGTPA